MLVSNRFCVSILIGFCVASAIGCGKSGVSAVDDSVLVYDMLKFLQPVDEKLCVASFQIHNRGRDRILLLSSEASCSCLAVSYPPHIDAGETATIQLSASRVAAGLSTSRRFGGIVHTDSITDPSIVMSVSLPSENGNDFESAENADLVFDIGPVIPGEEIEFVSKFVGQSYPEAKIFQRASHSQAALALAIEVSRDETNDFDAVLHGYAPAKVGPFQLFGHLEAEHYVWRDLDIVLNGVVRARLTIPSDIFLGAGLVGDTRTVDVEVKPNLAEAIHPGIAVEVVECDNTLTATWDKVAERVRLVWKIEVPGPFEGLVVLEENGTTYEITVHGLGLQ
jgi:hypothetical protein